MNFNNLTFLIHLFEIIAALLAVIHYKKYKTSTEKYFMHFLWYTVLTELIGVFQSIYLKINNTNIYIIFMFVSFLFYSYWFHSVLKSKNQKKMVLWLSCLFAVITMYNFFALDWKNYHIPTFVVGAINTIVFSFMYFSELLGSDEVLKIKNKLSFWITTGLLLFNVGMVPLVVFSETFNAYSEVRIIILISLNIILYTCYSLGFIWGKKKHVSL